MSENREHVVYVHIHLPGETQPVPAGRLSVFESPRAGSARFSYGRRYLERPNAVPLDPVSLPLEPREFETPESFWMFPGIADAAPDSWGRHVLARAADYGELTDFQYLVAGRRPWRFGALDFGSTPRTTGDLFPEIVLAPNDNDDDLEVLIEAAEKAESADDLDQVHRKFLVRGSSLGGARPKMPARWKDGFWIAKFQRDNDTVDVPRLEYAAMLMARRAGCEVPPLDLVEVQGKSVFLIERFDRGRASGGDWARVHGISGLTALGAHERDRDRWGYGDLADFIRRIGADPARDLRELFRRMVVNVVLGNDDDHLKNFCFLWDPQKKMWRLSPLYDVVPSTRLTGSETYSFLRLAKGRLQTLENAVALHGRFQMEREEAEEMANHVHEAVRGRFSLCLDEAGVEKDEKRRIERAVFRGTW